MDKTSTIKYSVVIPVFNSAKTLEELFRRIKNTFYDLGLDYEVVFVDDCSIDDSWKQLLAIKSAHKEARIIRLSNNFGQWSATMCGVKKSTGDFIITIDDDLQYQPEDISQLINKLHQENLLLVYGIPTRDQDEKIRRVRNLFLNYFLQKSKTSSFKIFDRKIIPTTKTKFHFEAYDKWLIADHLKGCVTVNHEARKAGRSGYSLLKKIQLITSHASEYFDKPLQFLVYLGIAITGCSIFLILFFLMRRHYVEHDITYHILWAVLFNSGVILITLGLMGNYLSKIFLNQKGRPDFHVIDEQ